ncbi:MAG: hypothetical protein P0S95_02055 [Rhabdochlamydiaceae bacterium]|nr:hypothetical protein [Candidatus Amphrikana amoebophyrae]
MSPDIQSPGNMEPINPKEPIGGHDEGAKSFGDYMEPNQEATSTDAGTKTAENVPSPMDIARGPTQPQAVPTMDSVNAQMANASSSLGDLQQQLNTKDLKLKPSAKYLLRNKLTEANAKIRDAASKSGVDVGPNIENIGRNNPVMKFLGLVTDGMKQLNAAQNHIAMLGKNGTSLRPAELLMVQAKLARAQQEIEYSSTILANSVSDIKMLFNTQI